MHFQETPDDADKQIMNDKDHYRIADLTTDPFNDTKSSYFHNSIGGYHGAKMRRYQDIIEKHLGSELQTTVSLLQQGQSNIDGIPILNMLNTKYFKLGNSSNAVLNNQGSLGNAWFVSGIISVPDADAAIDAIGREDLRTVAISEKLETASALSMGSLQLQSYEPNSIIYSSSNIGKGFAVFSEVYYPKGWKAFIDNVEIPIHQVNYVLRGIWIESGDHEIEFKFEPDSYFIGNWIMLIGSVLLIGILFYGGYEELKTGNSD